MIVNKILILLVIPLVLAVSSAISGCGGLPDNAAAQVNGTLITKDAVDARIDYRNKLFPGMVSRDDVANFAKIRRQTTMDLVSAELEKQEANRRGITVSDADVDNELVSMSEDEYLGDVNRMIDEYSAKGITIADLRQDARERLTHDRLSEAVRNEINISEDQIQGYYQKNQQVYNQPDLLQARQIVTASEADAQKAAGLISSGESFVSVAEQLSVDPTAAKNGGSLGLVAPGQLAPEVGAALSGMSVGQVSQPVQSGGKWFLLTVENEQRGQSVSLEQAHDQIKQMLTENALADRMKTLTDGLKAGSSLQYAPDYDPRQESATA